MPRSTRGDANGEAQIATTLHLAEVPYRYEAEFPVPDEHGSKEGKRYFPDFYLPDQPESWGKEHGPTGAHAGVWLEHFATDANGKLPKRWDEDEVGSTAEYRRTRVHATLERRLDFDVEDVSLQPAGHLLDASSCRMNSTVITSAFADQRQPRTA